ncbi:carotenoid cleavage dioxygenase 1 [Diaporthe helianthi]|uniref:Carotenoid cleavage dioxygenase 1 n=1 Tax=Diaporthe helianthi TaxID=158607 RepID=A0A2P5HM55_DIAHE|nr:carotenoid cleavage dioxygenase 1 [Diaporthe helianthi]
MAADMTPRPQTAIARLKDHEQEDLEDAVRSAVNGAYLHWPNEAGFANLDEHRGPIELPVRGRIPAWAAGSIYRTGPGANKVNNTPGGTLQISHWFDGLAHTHRFDIVATNDGVKSKVWYSSRRQADDFVNHVQKNGMRDIVTFGQRADPCIGLFGKVMSSWVVAHTGRETKKAENIGVTVQLDVPGLTCVAKGGAVLPRLNTVWLGTDCHLLRQVDKKSLEPIGIARQDGLHAELDGELSCAHAQRCPTTGDYININIKAGYPATYKVFRVSAATGETEILATISHQKLPTAYIHSFFLSRHFVVLRVPSSHISKHGLSVLWKRNILDALKPFDQSKKNKWFVIDRISGRGVLAEFETEAAFFFHTVNCFDIQYPELGKWTINCDTIEYPNMNVLKGLYYDVMLNQGGKASTVWGTEEQARGMLPQLKRWKFTLPMTHRIPPRRRPSQSSTFHDWVKTALLKQGEKLAQKVRHRARVVAGVFRGLPARALSMLRQRPISHKVQMEGGLQERGADPSKSTEGGAISDARSTSTIEIPSPHVGELPTINPAYHAKAYRYVYSLAMSGRSTLMDTIVKTNLVSRAVLQWDNPLGHTPGEAIFVRRPGAVKEDDGVLLSVVLDGFSKKSYLLCLDARTMLEMGRAEMDFAVGFGFHGVHEPDLPIATTSEEGSGECEKK